MQAIYKVIYKNQKTNLHANIHDLIIYDLIYSRAHGSSEYSTASTSMLRHVTLIHELKKHEIKPQCIPQCMLNTIEVSKVHSLEFSECSENSQNTFGGSHKKIQFLGTQLRMHRTRKTRIHSSLTSAVAEMTMLKYVTNTVPQPTP